MTNNKTEGVNGNDRTCVNPWEDQRAEALRHYEEVSTAAHHWSSFVENAIKAYQQPSSSPPAGVEQRAKGGIWVKAEERLPGKGKHVFCKDEKGNNFVCVYGNQHEIEISDFEEDQDETTADFFNDSVYLKPGWYELCEQRSGMYDEIYLKRNIIEWLDETQSIAGSESQGREAVMPNDIDSFMELMENHGWVFNKGMWHQDGYESRTTKQLYERYLRLHKPPTSPK